MTKYTVKNGEYMQSIITGLTQFKVAYYKTKKDADAFDRNYVIICAKDIERAAVCAKGLLTDAYKILEIDTIDIDVTVIF